MSPCGFAGHRFSKEIVIQNQGKHPVQLAWANSTFAALKSKQAKAQKHAGKAKQVSFTLLKIACIWLYSVRAQPIDSPNFFPILIVDTFICNSHKVLFKHILKK